MSRHVSFHHVHEQAKGLVKAWWRDESGQMGIGYAVTSVAGVFTAYQTTGIIGGQIADIFATITQTLDMVISGLH